MTDTPNEEQWVSDNVYRVTDDEADVVCYVVNVEEGAGIDCLPRNRTELADSANRTTEATTQPTTAGT